MLFVSFQYFAFFAIVLIAFYLIPGWRARKVLLLLASYCFYMAWNAKFIVFLVGLTLIDYCAALIIDRQNDAIRRKLALIASIAANVAFLGYFKYYNFLISGVLWLAETDPSPWMIHVILPLGISFHTFQSISYVSDVYSKRQFSVKNVLDYALYIAFFPQIVAGPIVRARDFFNDLFHWQRPSPEELSRGTFEIAAGLVKKLVFADRFAPIADGYFASPSGTSGMLGAWSAALSFGLQIYFDFSGYTDIAIGSALLLGFHFPENFRRPYLSASITEFWHRWHISLSTWFRDYIYIPLGGSRHGLLRTERNLLVTMLIAGLWHGANWTFLVWGLYHGALLSVERLTGLNRVTALRWLRVPVTFVLVLFGWVLFRAPDLVSAAATMSQMLAGPRGALPFGLGHYVLMGLALLGAVAEERWQGVSTVVRAPVWAQATAIAAALLAIEIFGVTEEIRSFVYFAF